MTYMPYQKLIQVISPATKNVETTPFIMIHGTIVSVMNIATMLRIAAQMQTTAILHKAQSEYSAYLVMQ